MAGLKPLQLAERYKLLSCSASSGPDPQALVAGLAIQTAKSSLTGSNF